MSTFKRVNLTEKELDNIILEMKKNGFSIEKEMHKDGGLAVKFIKAGEKPALLKFWFKPDGATILYKIGKNQNLSEEIAGNILNKFGRLEDVVQSLDGIPPDLFAELKDYLQNLDIKISEERKENEEIVVCRWYSNQKLTAHYYNSSKKLLLQGKKNRIYTEIILWYSQKKSTTVDDTIKLIFSNFDEIERVDEVFPEDVLKRKVSEKIGDAFYRLQNEQQKWLLVCEYLITLHKDLPDFYPTISSSLKVVEGVLKICLLDKCKISVNSREGGFKAIFGKDGKLRETHRKNIDSRQINAFEEGYSFIINRRNFLQHAEIISAVITKKDAEDILAEVYKILKNFYKSGLL